MLADIQELTASAISQWPKAVNDVACDFFFQRWRGFSISSGVHPPFFVIELNYLQNKLPYFGLYYMLQFNLNNPSLKNSKNW